MLEHRRMAVFCLFDDSDSRFKRFGDRFSGLDVEFLERLLHELETQLAKNLAILDLEQSLRGREEFIVLTAHALKSQMHRILGKTDFLRMSCVDLAGHTQLETIVKEIDEEVRRMNYRTKTLLHFVSAEDEQQYRFRFDKKASLYELIKDVVNQYFYEASARGIALNITSMGYLPNTYFDKPTMEIAISNILDNAVKYSKSNRSIYIDISHDLIHQLTNIQISDLGIGVPDDELERVFDPYFRGKWRDPKRFIHGTGIGLAVTKDIIAAHGGRIWCQSSKGKSGGVMSQSPEGFKVTFFLEIPDQPKEPK
jgi:signal transduction histidine kinase